MNGLSVNPGVPGIDYSVDAIGGDFCYGERYELLRLKNIFSWL